MNKYKFVEVSVLKNYPSSNLNRDMSGTPKTSYFGDIQRGRISSQCLKRNIRLSDFMKEAYGEESVGERTRRIDLGVMKELEKRGDYSAYAEDINAIVAKLGKSSDKAEKKEKDSDSGKGNKTIQLYSPNDYKVIADIIEKTVQEGGKVKDIKLEELLAKDILRPISLDIAMFGRMATTKSFSTVEAASQVFHGMTTHKVKIESDWFTAVDDVVSRLEGEQGSGHLGDFEFDSGCFYEYFNLDIEQLQKNMEVNNLSEEELYNCVKQYIKAACLTNPTGKQNSFAAYVLPSLVMVELKEKKVQLNYVNAYVTPVKNTAEGNIVENSISVLSDYVDKCDNFYSLCDKRYWVSLDGGEKHPEKAEVYTDLEKAIEDAVTEIKGE